MVAVLPYVPSFGEKLVPALAQAGSDVAQGLQKRHAMTSLQQALSSISRPQSLGGMPMEGMPQQGTAPTGLNFSSLANLYPIAEKAVGPEAAKQLVSLYSQQLKSQDKQAQEIQKETRQVEAARNELIPSFDRLEELAKSSGGKFGVKAILGKIPYTPWAEEREELNQLGIWTADKLYTHFNKGTLAQTKWEDLKEKFAPRADLSDRKNMARINAMRRIAGINPNASAKEINKSLDREVKKIDSISSKKSEKPSLEEIFQT